MQFSNISLYNISFKIFYLVKAGIVKHASVLNIFHNKIYLGIENVYVK